MRVIERKNPDRYRAKNKEWREANKDRLNAERRQKYSTDDAFRRNVRDRLHRWSYGMALEDRDKLFELQGNRCANLLCCTIDPGPEEWCLDHCHSSGKIRGILCGACNRALGHAQENAKRLRGLADYVEKHCV